MDISKYPIHKFFDFIAAIIPGFTALLIFDRAHPHAFDWFFAFNMIGYRTRVSLILIGCFVVGYTLTSFLTVFMGGFGGAVGAYVGSKPYRSAHSFTVAPWRDPRWRAALKAFLGTDAPNDTQLMSQEIFDLRRQLAEQTPGPLATATLAALNIEKLNLEIDDGRWEQWYDHYHRIILQLQNPDISFQMRIGLNSAMEVAGLYVLFSAFLVPDVRHWWCLIPACGWVFIFVAEVYAQLKNFQNKWLTLSQQIEYLSRGRANSEAAKAGAGS